MIADDNIRLAIYKAAKNKRKNNKRHKRLRYIRDHVDEYIPIVRKWILEFEPAEHTPVEINDGISAKKRYIIVPTVREMIVHHAVANVLKPILTSGMYEHSYASIPGRGLHAGMKITCKWIYNDHKNTKYCLKLDIRKFFDSIDQNVLLERLRRKIRDRRYFEYIEKIVCTTKTGIPLGFVTSQWFANYLLTELDHKIKEDIHVKYYIRFMDDMVLFGSNKRTMHNIRRQISEYLENELHLQLKGNWQVFFMDSVRSRKKKGRVLDFLGFKFYRNHVGLRSRLALKVQRKAKKIFKKGYTNIHDARQIIVYAGLIKYADCYKWFMTHIAPFVNMKKMRHKISVYDRKRNKSKGGMKIEYMV